MTWSYDPEGVIRSGTSNMKIDNMRLEHHEKVVKMAQKEQQEAGSCRTG